MTEGTKFITVDAETVMLTPDRSLHLPPNKVCTFIREDNSGLWFDVDGRECLLFPCREGAMREFPCSREVEMRELPYPIEKPSSIAEYQQLLCKIVRDMEDVLGIKYVNVEANIMQATIHIGGPIDG